MVLGEKVNGLYGKIKQCYLQVFPPGPVQKPSCPCFPFQSYCHHISKFFLLQFSFCGFRNTTPPFIWQQQNQGWETQGKGYNIPPLLKSITENNCLMFMYLTSQLLLSNTKFQDNTSKHVYNMYDHILSVIKMLTIKGTLSLRVISES